MPSVMQLQHQPHLKRSGCMQAVLPMVRLLAHSFPTVQFHSSTMVLAAAQGAPAGEVVPTGDHISLYDMETGQRKRSLQLRFGTCCHAILRAGIAAEMLLRPWTLGHASQPTQRCEHAGSATCTLR